MNICKDILRKLINDHLDPKTALNCLLVCKKFNECVNKEKIVRKYLKMLCLKGNKNLIEEIRKHTCQKCNFFHGELITDERSIFWRKHMQKHLKQEKAGKEIVINKGDLPCPYCCLPFLGERAYGHLRTCHMKIVECSAHKMQCRWVECLCQKRAGFLKEMKDHSCDILCKLCNKTLKYKINDCFWRLIEQHIKTDCTTNLSMKELMNESTF